MGTLRDKTTVFVTLLITVELSGSKFSQIHSVSGFGSTRSEYLIRDRFEEKLRNFFERSVIFPERKSQLAYLRLSGGSHQESDSIEHSDESPANENARESFNVERPPAQWEDIEDDKGVLMFACTTNSNELCDEILP